MSNAYTMTLIPDLYDRLEAIRSNEALPPKVRGYAIDFLDSMYSLEQDGGSPDSEWYTWVQMVQVFNETVRCFEGAL